MSHHSQNTRLIENLLNTTLEGWGHNIQLHSLFYGKDPCLKLINLEFELL